MTTSVDRNIPFQADNANDYLSPLVNKKLSSQAGHIASHLLPFPKCFYSMKILFIATGFINDHQNKWITFYVYLYRILLLALPFYVLGIIETGTNPLFSSINKTDQIIVQISFILLILNVYITYIFCIKHFKNHWLSLLYHSLSVDLGSDNDDYCIKCITDKFTKTSNKISIIVLCLIILSYIQWVIGNRYLQSLANIQHHFFYTYVIPFFWAIQIWQPLFAVVSLLYIIGLLLKQKSDILIGRIHASSTRKWNITSIISQHPYSSIQSDKLKAFDTWWNLMDSYIKLKTEYNDISSKWNLYLIITLIVIMSQSVTVLIMLLQSSDLLVVAIIFSFQFILILCAMFWVLARLSKQSNNILKIISMVDFGKEVEHIEVLRFIQLIQINPCTITIYGVQVTYNKAIVLIGTLLSFISGSLTKYFVDTLKS